jgi:hypothetical protein
LINNRQNGRRRGRGGGPRTPNSAPQVNRQDNRSRGNASQLHEKYKALARDAQLAGDRVQAEYYLQFADHYFRVLNESRARFEEQRRQRGDYQSDEDEEQEEAASAARDRDDEEQDEEERQERSAANAKPLVTRELTASHEHGVPAAGTIGKRKRVTASESRSIVFLRQSRLWTPRRSAQSVAAPPAGRVARPGKRKSLPRPDHSRYNRMGGELRLAAFFLLRCSATNLTPECQCLVIEEAAAEPPTDPCISPLLPGKAAKYLVMKLTSECHLKIISAS